MVGGKYIDGQYIMQMKSLNKEPMEHGRSRVFQKHVEALTKDGLIESKVLIKTSQWLKITEKVSFYIASEASYVYISVEKSSTKMPKNGQFGEFLKT